MRSSSSAAIWLVATWIALSGLESAATTEAGQNWEVKREKDGIVVSTRDVAESRYKAVKAEMTIPAVKLAALVGLVSSTACAEITSLCRESRVVEQVSETELFVYSYNDIPWPVADRDAVARVTWSQDPATLAVSMTATAVDNKEPLTKAVRIKVAVTKWQFTPQPDGEIHVLSEAHVDPEGPMPAWVTNFLLVDSPLETMINLRNIIAAGRYDSSHFDFLTEPSRPEATANPGD